jgi:hydrogenase expression/formation protein HypC
LRSPRACGKLAGMCLAIPGLLEDVRDVDGLRMGRVRFGGVTRDAVLDAVPAAKVGDYVLVHVGFALSVVDPEEARRTFALLEELDQLDELAPSGDEEDA